MGRISAYAPLAADYIHTRISIKCTRMDPVDAR